MWLTVVCELEACCCRLLVGGKFQPKIVGGAGEEETLHGHARVCSKESCCAIFTIVDLLRDRDYPPKNRFACSEAMKWKKLNSKASRTTFYSTTTHCLLIFPFPNNISFQGLNKCTDTQRVCHSTLLIGALDKTSAFRNECLSAVKRGQQMHLHHVCGA